MRSIGIVLGVMTLTLGAGGVVAESVGAVGPLGPDGPTLEITVHCAPRAAVAVTPPTKVAVVPVRGPLGPDGPTIGNRDALSSGDDGALGPAGPTGGSDADPTCVDDDGSLGPAGPTAGVIVVVPKSRGQADSS